MICPYCHKEMDSDWEYESEMYSMDVGDKIYENCIFCDKRFKIIAELKWDSEELDDIDDEEEIKRLEEENENEN